MAKQEPMPYLCLNDYTENPNISDKQIQTDITCFEKTVFFYYIVIYSIFTIGFIICVLKLSNII